MSRHRLSLVQRKTLVLDLDETLIHSHHDGLPRNPTIKPGTPHDFTVRKSIFHSTKIFWCCVRKEEDKKRRKEIEEQDFHFICAPKHQSFPSIWTNRKTIFFTGLSCHRSSSRQIFRSQATARRLFPRHCVSVVRPGCVHSKYGDLWCSCCW